MGTAWARDAIEVLTDHPLSGRFAGWSRDCRQSFYHERAHRLEPTHPGVETLARMIDYTGSDLGISMTAFTNELGGRIVVMGYFPWSMMHQLAKSSQIKAVCAWLSRGQLPIWLDSFARVHLWVRQPTPDRLACLLLNASLDPVSDPVFRLASAYKTHQWTAMDGTPTPLTRTGGSEQEANRIHATALKPWSVSLLTARDRTT